MPSPLLLLANAPALDPSPPSRRRARALAAPLATSLIAAVMGITACDSPDDPPLSLRQGDIQPVDIEPASLACMLQTQVFLHHADNTIEATPDVQHAFSDLLRAGDRVDFTFIPDPACDNQGKRLTLAAYALDSAYDDSPPPHPELFALDVSALAPDGGTLSVQMPPCATLLLHEGGPVQSPGDLSAAQVLAKNSVGVENCAASPMRVESFATTGPSWGDAPFKAGFTWQVDQNKGGNQSKTPLRCSFDFDGDGTIDQVLKSCAGIQKDVLLPPASFTYTTPGRHDALMIVSDGVRSTFAQTIIYANHLEYHPDVRFPEQTDALLDAVVTVAPDKSSADVVLTYQNPADVPAVAVGQVVVGHGGQTAAGYVLRVTSVAKSGAALTFTGTPAPLNEVVADGFFGMRDHQLSTAEARCISPECADATITPVAAPPPWPTPGEGQGLLKGLDALDDDIESKHGVKFAKGFGPKDAQGDQPGQIEVFIGVKINDFVLDFGLWSIESAVVDITPTLEVSVSTQSALHDEFTIGTYSFPIASVPFLSIDYIPEIRPEASFKMSIKGSLTAPTRISKGANGWQHAFRVVFGTDPDGFAGDVGNEVELAVKLTTVHAFELALGILAGPYIAPTIGFGVKATIGSSLEQPCQWCTSIFLEGGAELGWHAPWGEDFFEPKAIVLSEAEFSKECGPLDLGDLCDGGDAYGVTPTPESTFDCQTMNFKFRAPGAAGAGQDDAEIAFIIDLEIWSAPNDEWILWETFSSADTPWNGWPSLWFHCEDVGPGWGECTYVQNQSGEASLCGQHMMPTDKARWSVTRFGDPAPLFTYEFFVTGSVG